MAALLDFSWISSSFLGVWYSGIQLEFSMIFILGYSLCLIEPLCLELVEEVESDNGVL